MNTRTLLVGVLAWPLHHAEGDRLGVAFMLRAGTSLRVVGGTNDGKTSIVRYAGNTLHVPADFLTPALPLT